MNKCTKRILLANDVIQQIKSHRFVANGGLLFSSNTNSALTEEMNAKNLNVESGADFQKLLCETQTPCEVCANGALLFSTIMRFDSVTKKEIGIGDYDRIHQIPAIKRIFTQRMLNEIEYLFEGQSFGWHLPMKPERFLKLSETRRNIIAKVGDDENKILIAIMEMILNNDGKAVVL